LTVDNNAEKFKLVQRSTLSSSILSVSVYPSVSVVMSFKLCFVSFD